MEREMEMEREREMEMEREREIKMKMEREREMEEEEKERERELENEKERKREKDKENEREREEEEKKNEIERERQRQIQIEKERRLQIEKEKERLRRIRKKKEPKIDASVEIMPKLNPASKIISQEVLTAPPTAKWKDAAIEAVTTIANCMATSNIETDDKLQLAIENDEFKNRYDKTKFYYYFNETPRYNENSVLISILNDCDLSKLMIREFKIGINHVLKHPFLKIIKKYK